MTDKPMTDIVERLRGHDWDGSGFSESLAEEAADEIERLRAIAQAHNDSLVERIAENERLAEQVADYDEQITSLYLERARLEAENERLKRLLGDRNG
jgi:hypothetical protein